MPSRFLVKTTLILLNLAVWFSVGIFLSLGLFELTKSDYVNIVDTSNHDELKFVKLNAFVMIGIGVFIFLSGFIGCCGSVKENKCLIGFYSLFLLIIIISQSILLVILFITKQEISINASYSYKNRINEFNFTTPGKFEFGFHQIQLKHNCCGARSYQDYQNSKYPGSCCGLKMIGDECSKESILNQESGCFKFIKEFINQRIYLNSAFLGAFLTVEILAFLFGVIYCKILIEAERILSYV